MFMIVGLGNPGKKYEKTRHNVGFLVVDRMQAKWGFGPWSEKFDALVSRGKLFSQDIMLVKPQTYMNLSGTSVAALMRYFKLHAATDLWVVQDDLDLASAKLRLRDLPSGPGGHRGILSLFERLETRDFKRIKIGVGRPEGQVPVENYVVEPFGKEEWPAIERSVENAVLAAETALAEGMSKAMSLYNNR